MLHKSTTNCVICSNTGTGAHKVIIIMEMSVSDLETM